mgnify:FL=1
MGDLARGGDGHEKPSQYYNQAQKHGNYQFIALDQIQKNFTATYVGPGKILENVTSSDINYHSHRGLQEFSYDTYKSCKTQEIILPPSLQMILPHDYVNYTKVTWSDGNGIEHVLYPMSKTGNHNTLAQQEDGTYVFAGGAATHPEGRARLMQDGPSKHMQSYGFQLANGFGFNNATNELTPSFLGPFRLQRNYLYYEEDINGNMIAQDSTITKPFLKEGMEVFHRGMESGTLVTRVSVQPSGGGNFTTEFYITKPTKAFQAVGVNNSARFVHFDDITNSTTWGKYKSSNSTSVGTGLINDPVNDNDSFFSNKGQRYGLDPQYAQSNGSFFISCEEGKIHFSSSLAGRNIILHYISDHIGDKNQMIIHKFAEEAMYKYIAYSCAQARTDVPQGIVQRLNQERKTETRKAKIRLSNIKLEEFTQIMRGNSKFIRH